MQKNQNDTNTPFIPLTFDFMFKRIFTLNPELFKDFLISVLQLDLEPKVSNATILNSELTKTIRKEYHKTVDILVTLNGTKTIDVELNSSKYEEIKYRNVLYIEKVMTTNIEEGTKLMDMANHYFYQLNLNTHKFKDGKGEKIFYLKEETTNELLVENLKIIHKSLDYYTNLYYNKRGKASKDVIWLSIINAKELKEIEEMASFIMDKKNKDKFVKDIKEASRDKLVLSEWEAEKMAALVKQASLKNAHLEGEEQGIKEGKEQGIKEGMEQGKEQKTLDMIQKMLQRNMSLEDIEDISGKSIKEIKEIEQSMKD